jgi:hypothetical protein
MNELKLPPPKEETEAKALLEWAHWRIWKADDGVKYRVSDLIIHVPNGALKGLADPKSRAIVMNNLKLQGLMPGVFDYIIPVPCWRLRYPGLWLELKRTEGGQVSEEQKIFEGRMIGLGWRTQVAKGWVAASEAIDRYLSCCSAQANPTKPMGNDKPGRPFNNDRNAPLPTDRLIDE